MHPQRLFLLYVVSNSGKRYWDCKLPCIKAQIELSSTFVYDQKMSTSGTCARNSHLSQGGTNDNDAHVCEPICINMYCRAKHNNQEKIPIHWGKEWQKFQSCKFIHGQYFCDNFILDCDVIRFTGMVIDVVRPPCVRCEFHAELPLVLIL